MSNQDEFINKLMKGETQQLVDAINERIRCDLESTTSERKSAINDHILNVLLEQSSDNPPYPEPSHRGTLFHIAYEIIGQLLSLAAYEQDFRRLSRRKFQRTPVEQLRRLISAYLNDVFVLRERLSGLAFPALNLTQGSEREHEIRALFEGKVRVEKRRWRPKLKGDIVKPLNSLIAMRNNAIHHYAYEDLLIRELSLHETFLLIDKWNPAPGKSTEAQNGLSKNFSRRYSSVRDRWAEIAKAVAPQLVDVSDRVLCCYLEGC